LPERLTATLEVESGSNDPMANDLTLSLIDVVNGTADSCHALLWLFVGQFGVGTLAGLLTGRLATWASNRINLDYPGLYPLLALAFGLVAFGLAAVLGGSGFLAVFIAGIVLGKSSIVFRRGIFCFHDAIPRGSELHPGAHLPAASGSDRPRRAPGQSLPGLDPRHDPEPRLGAGGGLSRDQ
jgi:cell volume regulation protein A